MASKILEFSPPLHQSRVSLFNVAFYTAALPDGKP
jgi:hypothetical protein